MTERTPGITRLLDKLETRRLVRRERCAPDRRQVLCEITPAGLTLLKRLDGPVDAADRESLRGLRRNDLETLIGLLNRIRTGLG